jgi:hypothetical protein
MNSVKRVSLYRKRLLLRRSWAIVPLQNVSKAASRMAIKLLDSVSSFAEVNDRETETAFFRTHVPWVAPLAYLHVIFKPLAETDLLAAISRLDLPSPLAGSFALQNGASLFSGNLKLYGLHKPGQLLNRSDPFSRLPFNIENENDRCSRDVLDHLLVIGGYGFDASRVCIDRQKLSVHAFRSNGRSLDTTPFYSWMSLDQWLTEEVARLSDLFGRDGRLLVHESETLPRQRRLN